MTGTGDYLLAMAALAVIAVSMAIAGRTMRRALLPGWTGAPALLATGLLALGTLVVISELPMLSMVSRSQSRSLPPVHTIHMLRPSISSCVNTGRLPLTRLSPSSLS